MNLTMSEWDALSDDDRDWALGVDGVPVCPICGTDDPERICQNPDFQRAWVFSTRTCYRTIAFNRGMKQFEGHPDAGAVVGSVTLDPSLAKSAQRR